MKTNSYRRTIMTVILISVLPFFLFQSSAVAAIPSAPAGLAAIAGNGEISLTWNPVDGASSYALYRSPAAGGPYDFVAQTAGTGHTNRGVNNGQTYYYVATAVNTDGESPYSAQVGKAPIANALPAPTGVTAIPGNGQISLAWNPVTSAVSYYVYRAVSKGGPYTLLTPPAPGPSFTDRGLTNGVSYFYVVQTQSTNPGAYSEEVSASPSLLLPLAPESVIVTPGSTWAGLSWSPSDGATGYAVYRATTAGGPYAFAAFSHGTTYEDMNLSNGTTAGITYYYLIAAVNANGRGAFSAEAHALVSENKPPHAAAISATPTGGSGGISLTWLAPAGAISYVVYRSTTQGDNYQPIHDPQPWNGFADNGLTDGTTYYYVVDTHNAGGVARSNEASVTPRPYMPVPDNVHVLPGNTQATVTWDPIGTAGYYVTVSTTPGGTYTQSSGSSSFPSFTAQNLTNPFRYYFRVQAVGGSYSGDSAEVSTVPSQALPQAPVNVSVTAGNGQTDVHWDPVEGATGYKIYRRIDGSPWPAPESPSGTVTGTLFTDQGLVNGIQYHYLVAAVNEQGAGAWSRTERDGTPSANAPLAPIHVKAIPGNTQATVTWDPVIGATDYYVTVSATPGGNYLSSGGGTSNTSFTALDLTNGSPYYFRVQAVGGLYSGFSAEVSAIPSKDLPMAPVNLSMTPGNTQLSVRWDAVGGATSYLIYRRTDGSAWSSDPVGATTGTLFTDRMLPNGVQYHYLVAAVNEQGAGAWSRFEANGTPSARGPLAPINVTVIPGHTQSTVAWDPVVGATDYYVTVTTASGGNYMSASGSSSDPSFTATGLTNESLYYFRVQAMGTQWSAFSAEVSTTPAAALPLAPVNLSTTPGNTELSIRWNPVVGATGYNVYRRTEGSAWTSDPIGSPAGTLFTDTGLINGTTYYYTVAAVNANGAGAWAAGVSGTPTGETTSAPVHVAATPGNQQVTVSWDPVAGATNYYVTVSASPGGQALSSNSGYGSGTSFVSTGLTNDQPYYFRVQAVGAQWSAFSAEVSAIPNPAANIGNISGRVSVNFAGNSSLGVGNAAISLQGTGYSTTPNANGNFTLLNVPFGNYQIVITAPDMDPVTQNISLSSGNLAVAIPQMAVSSSTCPTVIPGDANGDNLANLEDVIYLLQVVSGLR